MAAHSLTEFEVRRALGSFGLESIAHKVAIGALSGGQKARVVFADLWLLRPHVLLLDEPTNHLDIESVDALIEAVNDYGGGVVCVTHDAALIERTGCELWVCADGGCVSHEAGFEDYREGVLAAIEAEAVAEERRAEERRVERQRGLEAKRAARKPRSAGE